MTPPTWFIKILRQGRIGNIIRVKAFAFILNDNTNDIFVKIAFNGYFFEVSSLLPCLIALANPSSNANCISGRSMSLMPCDCHARLNLFLDICRDVQVTSKGLTVNHGFGHNCLYEMRTLNR